MRGKLSGLIVFVSLLSFFIIALVLRIIPAYSQLFVGDWVKFTSPDTYFFMRQVDHLVYNFPRLMANDPYFALSGGMGGIELNFFIYLLSAVTLLVSAGSPSPQVIDLAGMYFPVLLGAFAVVPGYFLGKALFDRWGGLLAAGLLAIMPGEYLSRTGLGAVDRDCLQVFLVLVTMLFTVLAVKYAGTSGLFARGSAKPDARVIAQASIFSLLAGIALGLFLLTWKGAFIFSAIILAFIMLQSAADVLKGRPADYLFVTGLMIFFAAALTYLPFVQSSVYRAALIGGLFLIILAALVNYAVARTGLRPFFYPVLLAVLAAALFGVACLLFPLQIQGIISNLNSVLNLTALDKTVSENLSILFPAGQFSLYTLWYNYTTGFYLSLVAIGMLIFTTFREGKPLNTFLLIWSITLLVLTLMMRRFALFYTVNVAVLSAYCCLKFLEYLGIIDASPEKLARQLKAREKSGRERKSQNPSRGTVPLASVILGVLPVLLLVFLPNVPTAVFVSGTLPSAPSNAWCGTLDWLKNKTPEPFGNPDFYYRDYAKEVSPKDIYPDSAYAVTAWWDYGYFIVRAAHRLPSCHPGGGNRKQVARLFTGQDMENAYMEARGLRSRYLVLDYPTVTNMYDSILLHAGVVREDYFDGYYKPVPGTKKLEPVVMYHPAYYRSLAVRLYNFDGGLVTPQSCQVIAWEERMSVEGPYKHLTGSQTFPSYEEALRFIEGRKSGNYRIVSEDPFRSPIPLEAVSGYRLAYSSEGKTKLSDGTEVPEVKVFEYIK